MEHISFLIHAYMYLLIYEILTEERKRSVKWFFLLLFGITRYIAELGTHTRYLWPFLLLTLLILYSICIRSTKSNLENFKYAIVSYGIDFILNMVMSSILGVIVGGLFEVYEISWRNFLLSAVRIIIIIALYKGKINFAKIKQDWVFYIVIVVTVVLLFSEQIIRLGKTTQNDSFIWLAVFCSYLIALFTSLWLIDHYKMLKIQKAYAADNRQMSQKLHRSKEILPLLADYVSGMDEAQDEKVRQKLQDVCRDYGKELSGAEMNAMLFNTTGIQLLDLLLQSRMNECFQRDIEMEVFVGAKIDEDMKRMSLGEGELVRMMGDLIRNAINAVEEMDSSERMILVVISRDEYGYIEVHIHDSGVPFPTEILEKFGERGNTTWGTGNGIADLVESLRRVHGSVEVIPETDPEDIFTKEICIRFDGSGRIEAASGQVPA